MVDIVTELCRKDRFLDQIEPATDPKRVQE
jgi:hypothetical protein